ncbi:MAG: FlgD immunoglobulin-like domain containing protein [Balneolaceae bacterium]
MRLLILFAFINIIAPAEILFSQAYGPVEDRYSTLRQNSASTLEAAGMQIWVGPGLNRIDELSGEIFAPQDADSIFDGRGRIYSLDVSNQTILGGVGYTSTRGGSESPTAMGYYLSDNAGVSWDFFSFPLDDRPPDECEADSVGPPCDIEFNYGGQTYIRTRITVPEQSPPYEVDLQGNVILSVNWASGLLRSIDRGNTWERLILPPSSESELNPANVYEWNSQGNGESINRYDPRFDTNLLGFGLLIDDNETVWVGTAGGINRSENALSAPFEEIEWDRIAFDPESENGLLANWIIKIRQQPGTNRIWMTNWRTDPENRDQFGLVYTDDGGETFRQFLTGEKVNDFGFFEDRVYAAADDGLFYSSDDGASWERINQITSPNAYLPPDISYLAVTASDNRLWVGTSDGIASTENGSDWQIVRVNVPLRGGNIYQPDAPSVNTYAYPNPFSPQMHNEVRIKFETETEGEASLQIYDFSMTRVRSMKEAGISEPGSYEFIWDGRDRHGRFVSNGTYFYTIKTSDGEATGKILLLN